MSRRRRSQPPFSVRTVPTAPAELLRDPVAGLRGIASTTGWPLPIRRSAGRSLKRGRHTDRVGGHEYPGLVGWPGARPRGVTRLTAVAGRPGIALPVRSGQGGGGVIPHDQAPQSVLIPLGRKTGLRRVCRPSGTGSGGAGAAGLPCGLSVSRRVGLVHPPADRVLPVAAAGAQPVRHRGPDYSLAVRGTQPRGAGAGAGAGPVGREGVTRYGW